MEIPTKEPLDAETVDTTPRVKQLLDAIYTCPLTKDKLSAMYKEYPRPANLETLHKTRLNPDVQKYILANKHFDVIQRDEPLRSLQWVLQFLTRPLVDIISHLSSGDQAQPQAHCG